MADLDTGRYIVKAENKHGVVIDQMVFTRDPTYPDDVKFLMDSYIKICTDRGEIVYVYEPTGIHQPDMEELNDDTS